MGSRWELNKGSTKGSAKEQVTRIEVAVPQTDSSESVVQFLVLPHYVEHLGRGGGMNDRGTVEGYFVYIYYSKMVTKTEK